MKKLFWITLSIWLFGCASPKVANDPQKQNSPQALNAPYVLLISIDGYRYDYTQKIHPPALSLFAKEGSSAESLIPSFPSKTYPNHYTIVTGLYPENHGIVANTFYDFNRPANDQLFKLSNRPAVRDSSWYKGTPLWVAAENAGMLTASYFWPGDEQGQLPTYSFRYHEGPTNLDRVKQVMDWFSLPAEKRPHLVTLYFSDVDGAGHARGPDSKELNTAVLGVDAAIGLLLQQLKTLPFQVNVVVVSDHGMQALDDKNVEYLDDYADLSGTVTADVGQQVLIYGKDHPEKLEKIYQDLKSKGKHFKVYKRADIPAQLHYSKNSRIGDLVVMAQSPYLAATHESKFRAPAGGHGFDHNTTKNMHGIFYAKGPNIKSGKRLKSFKNIHIYPFILKLLGIPAVKNIDGDSTVLEKLAQ